MSRSFSPFTRLTLLISELKSRRLEELTDVTKCDLLYHTAKLPEGIEDAAHRASALEIGEQGKSLYDSIKAGETVKAESARETLLESCKKLKDLV